MVKRLRTALVLGAVCLSLGHWAALQGYPLFAMRITMARLGADGVNVLHLSPPVTPKTRRMVLPSPDLLYAACVYDVTDGPVLITMHPFEAYHSLSIYDAATNNFYVRNDQSLDGKGLLVRLEGSKQLSPSAEPMMQQYVRTLNGDFEIETVSVPSIKGVALIRRLAPNAPLQAAALAARTADKCTPVQMLNREVL